MVYVSFEYIVCQKYINICEATHDGYSRVSKISKSAIWKYKTSAHVVVHICQWGMYTVTHLCKKKHAQKQWMKIQKFKCDN